MVRPSSVMCLVSIENTEKWYTVFVNKVARFKNKSPIHTPKCANPRSFPRPFRLILIVHMSGIL